MPAEPIDLAEERQLRKLLRSLHQHREEVLRHGVDFELEAYTATYAVVTYRRLDGSGELRTIGCFRCGHWSNNPNDAARRYCARCGVFHLPARQHDDGDD